MLNESKGGCYTNFQPQWVEQSSQRFYAENPLNHLHCYQCNFTGFRGRYKLISGADYGVPIERTGKQRVRSGPFSAPSQCVEGLKYHAN
jgi:hypothetical protein